MLIKLQFIVPKSSINADAITPLGKRILSEISQSNTGPVIKKKKKDEEIKTQVWNTRTISDKILCIQGGMAVD